MANENRSGGGNRGGRGGRGGGMGRGGGRGGWEDSGDRGNGRGNGWNDRDRSPRRDEPPLDPYGPARPGYPPPPPADYHLRDQMRDPFYPDPYRRYPPDPWLPPHDDPYRREPFGDPYRDPYRAGAPPPAPPPIPPVIECEVFLVSTKLRDYGELIQMKVKDLNVISAVSVIPEGRTATQMTEELTLRKGLFAIFVNAQNEVHRSLTLNILHGTPQEHRNMPMEDAIILVGRSFQKYVDGLREKAAASAAPPPVASAPAARVFLPPSGEVSYLLNLLADNRALTVSELDCVLKYLHERRDKLIDVERRPLVTDDVYAKSPSSYRKSPSEQRDVVPAPGSKESTKLQQELTNKILSIFNGAGGNIQGVPPAGSSATPAPPPPPVAAASSEASSGANLINFDNPNVQAALDNLIQSSPGLLSNINTKPSTTQAQGSRPNVSSSGGASDNQNTGMGVNPPGPPPPGPPQGPRGQYPQGYMAGQGYPMYQPMGYGMPQGPRF